MAEWDHRQFGTRADPVRQSDLNQLASSYGCPKSFRFRKEEAASGEAVERDHVRGATALGNSTHGAFEKYLAGPHTARILAGEVPSDEAVRSIIRQGILEAAGTLPVEWGKDDPKTKVEEAVVMVRRGLEEVGKRAAEIVVVEEPFVAEIECFGKSYWLKGTIDLAYRPKEDPSGLVLVDWKSGETRLSQIILDHGYQFGIYAHALEHGLFGEAERRIGQFPTEILLGHLRDFLPYTKVTAKTVTRPEEAAFFGVELGTRVELPPAGGFPPPKLKKDGTPYKERERKRPVTRVEVEQRGPVFYRARRKPADVERLKHSIRKLVSSVRMGAMVEFIGEHCERCPFKLPCLTDGHAVHGDEKRALDSALRGVDLEGVDEDFAA